MEFTGAELAGGAELAASVEKTATDPVEKAAVGPRALEGCGMREVHWRGRKMGCRALARRRCRPTERRRGGEGSAVESAVAGAVRQSAVVVL